MLSLGCGHAQECGFQNEDFIAALQHRRNRLRPELLCSANASSVSSGMVLKVSGAASAPM
jgi:hypothetical protein